MPKLIGTKTDRAPAKALARSVGLSWPLVLLLIAVASAHLLGALQPLKAVLYENRFRLAQSSPSGDIILVEIDSKSIADVGTWPWPRKIHAALIDELSAAGVDQISFDVDFSSPSTDEQDGILEEALRRAGGGVVLAAFSQKFSSDPADSRLSYNLPITRFAQNAWSGTVNVFSDRDGIVRRFPTGHVIAGEPIPSMPMLIANGEAELGREFLIDFGIRASDIDRISAIDVLGKRVDHRRLAGKKVIVGASAIELRDFFQVPVFEIIPGPLVQALAAETIVKKRMLAESSVFPIASMFLAIALCAFCTIRARWSVGLVVLALGALLAEVGSLLVLRSYPLLLDTSAWEATLAGAALLGAVREIDFGRLMLAMSQRETRDTRVILDQVVADNFAGVVVATDDGIIRAASHAAAHILRAGSGTQLVGRHIDDALPSALAEIVWTAIDAYREGTWQPRAPGDFSYTRGENNSILEYVATPSRLESGGNDEVGRIVASLTFVDVTERRHAEARVAYMARFDPLTGLANHNQFAEKLSSAFEKARSAGQRCTIAYFDLDRFKSINDTLGRSYGDLLLQQVGERARALSSPADLVARLDADRFGILRFGDQDDQSLGTELIANLSRTYVLDSHRAHVGITVGMASIDEADESPAESMKNAETAHHRAKGAGGNSVAIFDPAQDRGLRFRQTLEIEMRDALDRDEFWVAYQPQADLLTNVLIGAEALLRWNHPQRGPISPADFIPVAEDTGLIEALGRRVLEQACRDAANWPKPIKIAVNISPIQFMRGDLARTVAEALQSSGLPPSQLDLEITESLFVRESSEIRSVTSELRKMGVSFSLDDFGTGYSSLNYLRKFQVDKIKLDRSFVTGLPQDAESVAIVRAVCALAKDLGIKTNAEGIDSPEQIVSLRLLGCEEGQGFLLGKPQAAGDIAALLAAPSSAVAA